MSDVLTQAQQRAAIVDALDGVTADVDGQLQTITAYPVQPAPVAAYQAWPIWMSTRPVTSCISETEWQVAVALPGADAQTWSLNGDGLLEAVADALGEWHVTRVEPGQLLVSDGATVPILLYTLDI